MPSFVFASFAQLGIVHINQTLIWSYLTGRWNLDQSAGSILSFGTGNYGILTRLMRSSLLEVINSDFVRTAKSKGLSPRQIFMNHELRNSILPVITIIGPAIASITTGSFVIETIFTIRGLVSNL